MPSVQIPNNNRIDNNGEKTIIGCNANCDIVIENNSRIALEQTAMKSVVGRWMMEPFTHGLVSSGDRKPAWLCYLKPKNHIQLASDSPEITFEPIGVPATTDDVCQNSYSSSSLTTSKPTITQAKGSDHERF